VKLVLGIDGGQSSTVAVVVDETGSLRGRGTAGPSDHVGQAADSRRAAAACELAAARALAAAGLPPAEPLAAVVVGMSGYDGAWHGVEPAFATARVRYVHDAPAALSGAIAGRPAGVVIAGTGSVGYGEDDRGGSVRVGGYGYLFGDGGSAFAIARDALADAMRASDHGVASDLGDAARAFFDVPDLHALARAVSLNRIDRPQLAAYARVVLDAARLGDPQARALVDAAAEALADLARSIATRLGGTPAVPVPVALVGGIGQNPMVAAAVRAHLGAQTPAAIVAAVADAAVGAALLAFDDAGLPRPAIHGAAV
jgi:N-acetylglucosamine kinase-like BadF-type ATPase